MKFTRRQTLAAALGSLGAGVLPRAQAQTQPFPSQVIKFVIPTPAGGDHDTMMRIIGQKLPPACSGEAFPTGLAVWAFLCSFLHCFR